MGWGSKKSENKFRLKKPAYRQTEETTPDSYRDSQITTVQSAKADLTTLFGLNFILFFLKKFKTKKIPIISDED